MTGLAWAALTGVVAVGACHLGAVRRLHRRGDRWPPGRSVAAAAGLGCLAVACLLPGLAVLDGRPATGHALTHLLVAMAAPLALALAAPATLALRTLPRRPGRLLLGVLRSRGARALTHPATVVALQVGGLVALYPTGLVEHLHHAGPVLAGAVHLHLLASGYLLAAVLAGPDPLPHRPSTRSALVVLVVVAAAHQVVMTVVYARAVPPTGLPGGTGLDVLRAAEIMRGGGHLLDAALATAVMARWYRRGARRLARQQRRERAVDAAGGSVVHHRPARALRPRSARSG